MRDFHNNDKQKETLFRDLYNDNFSLIQYYVFSYIKNAELAKDIAQDVFVSIWDNFNKLEPGKERSYMLVIARNKCLNILKRNKISTKYALQSKMDTKTDYLNLIALESTTSVVMKRELEVLINKAMKKMPVKTYSTFNLSRFNALKNVEIAEQENVSVRTVEYRIKSAVLILKKELKDYLVYIVILLSINNLI